MSDDSGASLACSVCGEELIVPDATPDNVKLGHEFLEQNGGSVTGATPNIEEEMTPRFTKRHVWKQERGPDLKHWYAHVSKGFLRKW
jgi:hypothetical protein